MSALTSTTRLSRDMAAFSGILVVSRSKRGVSLTASFCGASFENFRLGSVGFIDHRIRAKSEEFAQGIRVELSDPCSRGIDDGVGERFFFFEHGVNFFFDGALGEAFLHLDIFILTDTVCAVGGRSRDGGVPPSVEVEDVCGGREVEAGAACLE